MITSLKVLLINTVVLWKVWFPDEIEWVFVDIIFTIKKAFADESGMKGFDNKNSSMKDLGYYKVS